MLQTAIILSLVAFIAGFIDSIAGGGGLLLVPSLLIAGLPPQVALGTNKFAATIGTSVALGNFIRKKKVVGKIIIHGIFFALVGAFIGTKLILTFDSAIVGKIIIFLLPVGILATLLPKKDWVSRAVFSKIDLRLKIPLICLAIGFYDGFFGPGTVSFFIIAFHLLLGLGLVEASATSKVFNLTSNFASLVAFLLAGKVIFVLGLPLAAASIVGNYLGSHLAIKKGAKIVKLFLIISLTILLATLIWKYFLA